jgi:predicted aspartyl protease
VAAPKAVALILCVACAAPPPPDVTPEESAAAIAMALQGGRLEQAVAARALARDRHPGNTLVLFWSATVSALLWDDDRAAHELAAAMRIDANEHTLPGDCSGILGDLLFQAGRFGESAAPLLGGTAAADAARRRAFAALAQKLPARRKAVTPLATERAASKGELPEFECAVGVRRRGFAIDTGSSMTTVSRSLANELSARDLFPAGNAIDGAGRSVKVDAAVLDPFAVGDVDLGAVPVLVVDDSMFALRDLFGGPERPVHAVLGLDHLSLFRITFDPVRSSVTFELPRGLPPSDSVQCVRADGRCLVPVLLDSVRMWFVLDTGASNSSLTEAGLQALPGGSERAVQAFRRVRTLAGATVAVRSVHDLALRVDRVRFRGQELPIVQRSAGSSFPVHGVLGADLLLRCRLTLDSGRVRLEAVE